MFQVYIGDIGTDCRYLMSATGEKTVLYHFCDSFQFTVGKSDKLQNLDIDFWRGGKQNSGKNFWYGCNPPPQACLTNLHIKFIPEEKNLIYIVMEAWNPL